MYEVSVRHHFDAAHALRGYGGKCENLHGHRFEVVVMVQAQGLNEIGIAYDFVELKSISRNSWRAWTTTTSTIPRPSTSSTPPRRTWPPSSTGRWPLA